jgi:hypothetical protein
MPDDRLVSAELGSDIDLPRTLLVQLNNKGTLGLEDAAPRRHDPSECE